LHAYYGICGFIAVCQSKVPVIITFCGSDLNPGFAGRRRTFLRSRIITTLGQLASLRAGACIVRSREMLARLRLQAVRQRTRIITSGIDLHRFAPSSRALARLRLAWDPDRPVVLFVCADAALPAVKQPELARATLSRLKKTIPDVELRIVAGRPQEELPDYYNASDVLLLSSANEGSPNVVKEALACNLPVVSTRVGDVEELLAGLKNCHLCEADPEDLSGKLAEVLASGERTQSRARMEPFSLEQTSAAILEIYKELNPKSGKELELSSALEGPVP
jgi:glycosyltransferase involved in cell wall biosynthesis